ncbi:MAG: hypothetical protein NDJ89_02580 [Oligoflexia bacterium]|nr:hypothetical protein [Oligoflexia bacterium]
MISLQPARAFVGFWTGNPALTIAGFVVAAGPAAHGALKGKKPGAMTFLSAAIGVIIMDGEAGQTMKFVPVSAAQAQELGLTRSEMTAYNDETEELNQIYEAVIADLDALENPTIEQAARAWDNYAGSISEEAVSGARKIASKLFVE